MWFICSLYSLICIYLYILYYIIFIIYKYIYYIYIYIYIKQANIFKNNTIEFDFIMLVSKKWNTYTVITFVINFTLCKRSIYRTYYKLRYIGDVSVRTKKKVDELCKRFCKKTDINIVLTLFKIASCFSSKDEMNWDLLLFINLQVVDTCSITLAEQDVSDYAFSPFRLKVKEGSHISWMNTDLRKQKEHVSIIISV